MKKIELSKSSMTLAELIALAKNDNLLIKSAGKEFVFALIDDFDAEVESLRKSKKFLAFLDKRSKEPATISLKDARKALLGDK